MTQGSVPSADFDELFPTGEELLDSRPTRSQCLTECGVANVPRRDPQHARWRTLFLEESHEVSILGEHDHVCCSSF